MTEPRRLASKSLAVEVWSPLPPLESGVADYVHEQLDSLDRSLDLTLVAEDEGRVDEAIRRRYRVVSKSRSDATKLRVYHIGNSPLHAFVYREAIRVPGVVILHEWNLHELLLGFAVTANDFDAYRSQMRREHGARGSIAAQTIASALGGRHWSSVFPLNAEVLDGALAVVSLSASTAARVAARRIGVPLLHLPHHGLLRSRATNRSEARVILGLDAEARVILAPGLSTTAKSLDTARRAMDLIRSRAPRAILVTVGGGDRIEPTPAEGPTIHQLGRVDLETLGDALLAADVVLALRFPSRGETSGVLMRALAAGRAAIVSSGSTADADLPEGVVARVNPGPAEIDELAALLEFLLNDDRSRLRLERLAAATAAARGVEPLTERLAGFLVEVARDRASLGADIRMRGKEASRLHTLFRNEVEAAGASLGLPRVPSRIYDRLAELQ